MLRFACLTAILLMITCKFCIGESDDCCVRSTPKGKEEELKISHTFERCWIIIVPPNYLLQLNLLKYASSHDCSHTKITVTVAKSNEIYRFCPKESLPWRPVIAFDDIKIIFEINKRSPFAFITSDIEMIYSVENILCIEVNSFKCTSTNCIPQSEVCDGIKQCLNGADESGCKYGVFAVKGIAESRHKAAKWLKNKWSSSTGWQENTHRGIIAWYLATGNNATDIHIDDSLMVNRLVIETLASLLRNKTSPLTINQLSMFVNALTVSCRDPRNFHGFDLVKILKQQTEISSLTNRPISYLALCNAGESIPLNETAKLVDILNSRSKYPFLPDVQAASIMALSCLCYNKDDKSIQIPYIKVGYDRIVEKFKKLQQVDGSFGTIYTTAIVTQALLSARQENDKGWKLNITVNYLMKYLNSPSVDFLATYWTLPILNGKSLSDIKNTDCPVVLQKNSEGPMMKDVKVNLRSKMRVQYSLYIGDEKDIIHTISLRVPENITVYEVMQLAEVADYKYKFQWKKMEKKLYIYEIDGIVNDFENDQFWLLYLGPNIESIKHFTESPDKVVATNGSQIIMWYKKAHI